MNFKLLIALFAAAALATGTLACDEKKADDKKEEAKKDDKKDEEKEGDTKEAKDEGGGDMPEACEKYIKLAEECAGKIEDAAAKSAFEQGMKATKDGWKSIPDQDALNKSCETAVKMMEENPACK